MSWGSEQDPNGEAIPAEEVGDGYWKIGIDTDGDGKANYYGFAQVVDDTQNNSPNWSLGASVDINGNPLVGGGGGSWGGTGGPEGPPDPCDTVTNNNRTKMNKMLRDINAVEKPSGNTQVKGTGWNEFIHTADSLNNKEISTSFNQYDNGGVDKDRLTQILTSIDNNTTVEIQTFSNTIATYTAILWGFRPCLRRVTSIPRCLWCQILHSLFCV